ncbi:MAG: response regulator [Candidatus Eremiobacteraeota bacterium]|nr:response regulator [Candidatus Eremiobacteraeota bacterium]
MDKIRFPFHGTIEKIVHIDDDPDILTMMELLLSVRGFTVFTAPNAVAGLERIKAKEPDLVLLDIMMPGGDGFKAAQSITDGYDVPVIVLSGLSDEKYIERAKLLGVKHFMTKPVDMDAFVRIIREIERERREGERGQTPPEQAAPPGADEVPRKAGQAVSPVPPAPSVQQVQEVPQRKPELPREAEPLFISRGLEKTEVPLKAEPLQKSAPPPGRPGKTVLVIDDDEEVLRSLRQSLEREGYVLAGVSDEEQALREAAARKPSLIILEAALRHEKGFQVLERLQSIHGSIPVIILSRLQFSDYEDEARKRGILYMLQKPYDRDLLLEFIDMACVSF